MSRRVVVRGAGAHLHPSRLRLVAALAGHPGPAETAPLRVLLIADEVGADAVSLALSTPSAEVTAVAVGAVPTEQAQALAVACGASITWHNLRPAALSADLGTFDVVIVHGLYSWLSPADRSALRAALPGLLAPAGLAVVDYNTLPGWHLRAAMRDSVRYHVRHIDDPQVAVQQARGLVGFLAASVSPGQPAWLRTVTEERDLLAQVDDATVYRDLLGEHNEAFAFEQVVADFATAGLHTLGDADLAHRLNERIPAPVLEALRVVTDDPIALEQAVDLCVNRTTRATVFAAQAAGDSAKALPSGGFLRVVSGPDSELDVGSQLLLERIGAVGGQPQPEAVVQLPADGPRLLRLVAMGLVAWRHDRVELAEAVSDRPVASRLARSAAAAALASCPNVWHEQVDLSPVQRMLLPDLDGTNDHPALVERLVQHGQSGSFRLRAPDGSAVTDAAVLRGMLATAVDDALRSLLDDGLLVG